MAFEMFQIDTKGSCLLCLQECDIVFRPGDPRQMSSSTAFKMLLRYLKVEITKIGEFSGFFQRHPEDADGVSFLISLCSRCSKVVTHFLQWFQEFDNIRIQLDKFCGELHDLIDEGGKDPFRLVEFQRKMGLFGGGGEGDQINARMTERLRLETLNKCAQRLRTSTPKVALNLKPMELPKHTVPLARVTVKQRGPYKKKVPVSSQPKRIKQRIPPPNTPQLPGVRKRGPRGPYKKKSGLQILPPPPLPPPFPHTSQRRQHNQEDLSSRDRVSCNLCGKVLCNRQSLANHHRQVHLKTGESFKCPHCGMLFTQQSNLNTHLVSKHTLATYSDRIPFGTSNHQLTTAIDSLMATMKKLQKKKYPFGCPCCMKGFSDRCGVRVHVIKAHFDKVLLNIHVGNEDWSTAPPPPPPPQNIRRNHQSKVPEEIVIKPEIIMEMDGDGEDEFWNMVESDANASMAGGVADIISPQQRRPRGMPKLEKISSSPPVRKSATVNIGLSSGGPRRGRRPVPESKRSRNRGGGSFQCSVCSKTFIRRDSLVFHFKLQHLDGKEQRNECSICGKTFAQVGSLNYHMVGSHALQHFAGKLPPGTSEADLKAAVGEMLAIRRRLDGDARYPAGCPFCPKEYPDGYGMKLHVMVSHFEQFHACVVQVKAGAGNPVQRNGLDVQQDFMDNENENHFDEEGDEEEMPIIVASTSSAYQSTWNEHEEGEAPIVADGNFETDEEDWAVPVLPVVEMQEPIEEEPTQFLDPLDL